jgi:hypothetical protein
MEESPYAHVTLTAEYIRENIFKRISEERLRASAAT